MATCITSKWGDDYSPQVKLTVTQSSSTATTATLTWKLEYIAEYAVSGSAVNKAWSVTINGTKVDSGNFVISGKTGAHTIDSGTVTINKTTSAQTISFSTSFTFNVTWASTYAGTKSASGSISVGAKTSYTVSYNANGGSGAPSSQTKWHGTNITLSSTKPTRTGYTFQGWSTANDSSVEYAAGATYSSNANVTLYAVWTANTYTVKYNANGGSGQPSNQTKTHDVALTLSSTKPTRTNYNFVGWGTSASATTVSYSPGGSYTANANITLYAIWTSAYALPRITNFEVYRCNSSGTANISGTYAKVKFNWATDKTVSSVKVYIKAAGATSWDNSSFNATGNSGTIDKTISGFAANTAYSVYVTVTDAGGTSTSQTLTVVGGSFTRDYLAGGNGVAFGKNAELDGYLDCNFKAKFRAAAEFASTPTVNGTAVSLNGHTHSEYAAANHTHSNYAASNHTHSNYALTSHNHDGTYAPKGNSAVVLWSGSSTAPSFTCSNLSDYKFFLVQPGSSSSAYLTWIVVPYDDAYATSAFRGIGGYETTSGTNGGEIYFLRGSVSGTTLTIASCWTRKTATMTTNSSATQLYIKTVLGVR